MSNWISVDNKQSNGERKKGTVQMSIEHISVWKLAEKRKQHMDFFLMFFEAQNMVGKL